MNVEDVKIECNAISSRINKRRITYQALSWFFACLEFTSACCMIASSASGVVASNRVTPYLSLATAITNALANGLHRYFNPEERAVSYNHQLRLCRSIYTELCQIPSQTSRRANTYYAYLQDLDFYMFSLSLPSSSNSSDDLSRYASTRDRAEHPVLDMKELTTQNTSSSRNSI